MTPVLSHQWKTHSLDTVTLWLEEARCAKEAVQMIQSALHRFEDLKNWFSATDHFHCTISDGEQNLVLTSVEGEAVIFG